MSLPRKLPYSLAINEALHQLMETDPSVFLMGQGVKSPWYVGNTAKDLLERFGEQRVIDTPVSENAITGAGVGAALAGMKPVIVHPRMDFMLYAFDPIINEAANWFYMNGGKASVPVVFWGIINRGGEQAAQHSQALHGIFSHIPGLKVVMPSTPFDAKGLMISAIRDPNPVVFIDDRLLYRLEADVPMDIYETPIGRAAIRKKGDDVTLAAISHMAFLAEQAAIELEKFGISAEVIDMRSAKPLDMDTVHDSVKKTGRLVIADPGWQSFGWAAEVAAYAVENMFDLLKGPVRRVCLPDCPAPASQVLEETYYPGIEDIVNVVGEVVG